MDNLNFKKLPGTVLPTVTGANAVIVETSSGQLYHIDSNGNGEILKKEAIRDYIYPVGSIYMSADSTSPAERFGGTWTALQNRFLVGAGGSYSGGSTGGTQNHSHAEGSLFAALSPVGGGGGYLDYKLVERSGWTATNRSTTSGLETNSTPHPDGIQVIGTTAEANNLPPYLAVYMWQRTA